MIFYSDDQAAARRVENRAADRVMIQGDLHGGDGRMNFLSSGKNRVIF